MSIVNESSASTQSDSVQRPIGWAHLLVISGILILGFGYSLWSTRNALQEQVATLQAKLDQSSQELNELRSDSQQKQTEIAANVGLITDRLGVTATDLQKAREQAQRIKQQQEIVEQKLAAELATKAATADVDTLRQEATTKMAELQQDATTKLGNVSGEVTVLREDVTATRQDLNRQLLDVKNVLSDGIARNASELAQLRMKGERNYIDLDIRKNKKTPFQRVGDIQLALSKTDAKKQKYSVVILVDDNRLEKKDRTANEPVQFLVGRDSLRYELVINSVTKDQIRGYISTPKDKVLSAEGPSSAAAR
jgi:hypothetical protein